MANETPIELPGPISTDEQLVDDDLKCVECNYNLRTLPQSSQCPECGHPISESLQGDDLEYANRKWLSKIHLGVRLLVAWFYINFFGFMVFVIARYVAIMKFGNFNYKEFAIWEFTAFIEAGILVTATFLLTLPDPRKRKRGFWYWVTRLSSCVYLLGAFGYLLYKLSRYNLAGPLNNAHFLDQAETACKLIIVFVPVAIQLGCLVFLRRLAKRNQDRILARHLLFSIIFCSSLMWFCLFDRHLFTALAWIGMLEENFLAILSNDGIMHVFQRDGWLMTLFKLFFICVLTACLAMVRRVRFPVQTIYDDGQAMYCVERLGAGYAARLTWALRLTAWALILIFACKYVYNYTAFFEGDYRFLSTSGIWVLITAAVLLVAGQVLIAVRASDTIRKKSLFRKSVAIILLAGIAGLSLAYVEVAAFFEAERGAKHDLFDHPSFDLSWFPTALIVTSLYTFLFQLFWIAKQADQRRIARHLLLLLALWLVYMIWQIPVLKINMHDLLDNGLERQYQDWNYFKKFLITIYWGRSFWTIITIDQFWRQLNRVNKQGRF